MCVAGYSGHVILFKFKKQECLSDILVLEIPITFENTDETDVSPECEFIPRSLPKQPDSMENEKKVCTSNEFFISHVDKSLANNTKSVDWLKVIHLVKLPTYCGFKHSQ